MSLFKRAILYIIRKWKKTLLIFFILFAVSTLVISGLAISDAQEEQSAGLRGTTGVSFSVGRNLSTGGRGNGNGGSYSTQEYISNEMIDSIAKIEGIKSYNASYKTILSLADKKGTALEQINRKGIAAVDCQFYSFGAINSEYNSLFLSGTLVMEEGQHITSSVGDGIIISKDIADKHNLKIGDSILAVNDPYSNDPTKELKIMGLFTVVADKTDEKSNYNMSSYYDYTEYAFISMPAMRELLVNYDDATEYDSADFFVSDPEQLEIVIQNVQNISSINWDNFIITANDEVYERVASSVSDIGSLISTLIVLIILVSVVIIVLILSMWMRSRKKEIGVLLSVGVSKPAILLQYIIETFLIAVIAFPSAYLLSQNVAGSFGSLFGKSATNILVTPQHFMVVAIVGCVLLVLSTIISCVPVMRYKPKEILSQMD